MWGWLLTGCSQVILVGFNNASFDDPVLLHHSKKHCEEELMVKVRTATYSADLRSRSIVGLKGNLEFHYNSCKGPPIQLHDALADCMAVCHILKSKTVSYDQLKKTAASIESIVQKLAHPLLKAKFVTPFVAVKIGAITCADYFKLSEYELIGFLETKGVPKSSIDARVKERLKYKDLLS